MPLLRFADDGYFHWCPGCDQMHHIPVPRWEFNNDQEKPTFTPSVKITWGSAPGSKCCHYNIINGGVVFHGDCTHALAGQTVPLPPIPDDE